MQIAKTTPVVIDKRERAVKALELRKAGISYEVIAQRLGYSNRTAAYRAVSRLIDSTEKEAVTDLREMELRRLDDLFRALYMKAIGGDLGAVDRCLKIMERRAKIAGIDAPEKSQSDVRQIIKVVYEDVQYAEEFNDDNDAQSAFLPAPSDELIIEGNQESADEEEYEEDGEE
jgi:hypothetical protein